MKGKQDYTCNMMAKAMEDTMKRIKVVVPRMLIKHHLPHPEPYGESLVELLNGMITDVYTNEQGELYTLTNNDKIIRYLNENSVKEPHYVVQNQKIQLITVQQSDAEVVLKWMNASIEESDLKYSLDDVRLYLSHAITKNAHVFIVKKSDVLVGIAGYTIIQNEAIINLSFYEEYVVTLLDEDKALKSLLKHVSDLYSVTCFKALVSFQDSSMIQCYKRNGFSEETLHSRNRLEIVYSLSKNQKVLTETEKDILTRFLSLYPKKLYDLANPDQWIDIEHAIDYALKTYAQLILSVQLDQSDEFGDIFLNDDGCLSVEDNLIKKYDAMMKHLHGDDLRVAEDYKCLIFAVLEIINKHIRYYQNMKILKYHR